MLCHNLLQYIVAHVSNKVSIYITGPGETCFYHHKLSRCFASLSREAHTSLCIDAGLPIYADNFSKSLKLI